MPRLLNEKIKVAWYARVSTKDQTLDNQRLEMERVAEVEGWENPTLYTDTGISGSKGRKARPGFDALLTDAEAGKFDVVAGWALDRMGRSTKDLIDLCHLAETKGFRLYLHKDKVDTGTATGKLLFTIMAAIAEMERARLIERVQAGLTRAKELGTRSGKPIGRPRASQDLEEKITQLRAQGKGIKAIAKVLRCGVSTVSRVVKGL